MLINLKSICLLALLLMLTAAFASAMGPAGHPGTIEGELRQILSHHLDSEGYMARFDNGQDLQRGISAYLWDNRNWLTATDFHRSRKVDAIICLLHKKGYPGLENYLQNELVRSWCEQLVRQP